MKGIMFKEELFKKVITGKKTETRRAVKVAPSLNALAKNWTDGNGTRKFMNKFGDIVVHTPRYQPGEVVYLKEPYFTGYGGKTFYRYIKPGLSDFDGWQNKMFMPASAARYFIRITSVEVERLQDIENDGIRREGVEIPHQNDLNTLLACWILLWDSINKPPYTWEDNPWVWVYRFELTEKPSTND